MSKWRKKPVVIEAHRVSVLIGSVAHNWKALPKWVVDGYDEGKVLFLNNQIQIKTLEGWMTADWDDWIIQGVEGEIYSCKNRIFFKTYESVDE